MRGATTDVGPGYPGHGRLDSPPAIERAVRHGGGEGPPPRAMYHRAGDVDGGKWEFATWSWKSAVQDITFTVCLTPWQPMVSSG
jgi:hypothetical protein